MKLLDLDLENLDIPFKQSFQHASATREGTEAVIVTARAENGMQGMGEGCPRHYVTSETLDTASQFFIRHRSSLLAISGMSDLKSWIASNCPDIDNNPAAFCAIELALINLLVATTGHSLEELMELPPLAGEFAYSGVLGVRNANHCQKQLQQYLKLGLSDFKLKLFGEFDIDYANVSLFRDHAGSKLRLRLDANNLWQDPASAIDYLRQLDYPFFAIEEPLAAQQYDNCRRIFNALGWPVILDESFIRIEQFENIRSDPATWVINIRVSKMGGLIRSLAVAERAKQLGIGVIIGAQVGETSILTRAGLCVAHFSRDNLLAQEGAFGTYLLERDLVEPSIMFGRGGIVKAECI